METLLRTIIAEHRMKIKNDQCIGEMACKEQYSIQQNSNYHTYQRSNIQIE